MASPVAHSRKHSCQSPVLGDFMQACKMAD
jgi:hypothetical protein